MQDWDSKGLKFSYLAKRKCDKNRAWWISAKNLFSLFFYFFIIFLLFFVLLLKSPWLLTFQINEIDGTLW